MGLLALAAILIAENVPPELEMKGGVDQTLPLELRPAVERASEAELDPKRGMGNALQILRAARQELGSDPRLALALDIRIAATVIRARFLTNPKVDEAARAQHALSTFSKLDLSEPGLARWIARALEADPAAKKQLAAKRKIGVAILTRGAGLDKDRILAALKKHYRGLGFEVVSAKAQDAAYVLKVAADEVVEPGKPTLVRVVLGLERIEDAKVVWRDAFYRTAEGELAKAIDSNLDWLIRIGGREMLFEWIARWGLPQAVMAKMGGHEEHGHGEEPKEAPRVRLPEGQRTQPPPPEAKP